MLYEQLLVQQCVGWYQLAARSLRHFGVVDRYSRQLLDRKIL